MLLTNKLPNKLGVFEKIFEIETNARFWINIYVEYEKEECSQNEKTQLLLSSIKDRNSFELLESRYKKRLLERILWFFSCDIFKNKEAENNNEKNSEKLYDFDKDSADITAAFQEAYGIDLTQDLDTMHWWRFMALFISLPSSTHFVSYKMRYRRLSPNDSEYKNASDEAKEIIDKIKKSVKLEDEIFDDFYFEDSIFDKIEREAKAKMKEVIEISEEQR